MIHENLKNIWLYELSHSHSWIINIWAQISMLYFAILSNVLCLWCPLVCRNFGKNSPITMKHLHSTQYSKGMRLLKTMIFSFYWYPWKLHIHVSFQILFFFSWHLLWCKCEGCPLHSNIQSAWFPLSFSIVLPDFNNPFCWCREKCVQDFFCKVTEWIPFFLVASFDEKCFRCLRQT